MRGVKSFNAPAFNAADDALQAAGHEVYNPARVDEANGIDLMRYDGTEDLTDIGFDLRGTLGDDLAWITRHADGVATLPGWESSMGAKAEVATADALGLKVGSVGYWTGWGAPDTALDAFVDVVTGYAIDFAAVTKVPPCDDCKYVPAIGDRVRIVDADYLGAGEHVGTVTTLTAGPIWAGRPHPIGVTADDGLLWCAVEVELIETAAEVAEYEEACRKDAMRERESDRALEALRVKLGADEVRVTSETGGQKGKKLAELGGIDPQALLTLAEVSGMGSRKYSAFNYLKGYDWSLSYNAMQRHALAFWAGQDGDDESGLPHIAHAAWHCLALLAFMQRGIGTDDRFKQEGV